MLTTLVSFLLVIGVLVFVHELGHLLAAKSVDIEVPRFSIGFGPRLFGFTWGETEYVISALPLGGYVRMAGMEDTAALEGGEEEPDREPTERDFDSKPLWARIWVVTAGVIMNFLFAILVVTGIGYHYGEPVSRETRVEVAAEAAPAAAQALSGVPRGAELTAVGAAAVEGWTDVERALEAAPAGALTLRFSDAPPATLQLPAGDSARQAVIGAIRPFIAPVIGEVIPSSPAARGGLRPGDRVVTAAGRPVTSWTEFVEVVQDHPGRELAVVVDRAGARTPLNLTPESAKETDETGREAQVGKLGVAPEIKVDHRPIGFGEALERGWTFTWSNSMLIVNLLGDLFTGDASPRSLGGPLTIGQISGEATRAGAEMLLTWMALLSINLAVLNLLPIPVLDGGQLLFLIVEGVRGRPLSVEQRLRLSHVGLILVVGIMVWALTNDFLRLFGI